MRKIRKWKYKNPKSIFISEKKFNSILENDSFVFIDSRNELDYKEGYIKGSIRVDKAFLESKILEYPLDQKMILLNTKKRSNAFIASWARFQGYKNIYLYKINLDEINLIKETY